MRNLVIEATSFYYTLVTIVTVMGIALYPLTISVKVVDSNAYSIVHSIQLHSHNLANSIILNLIYFLVVISL